jgi:hypothetical protein
VKIDIKKSKIKYFGTEEVFFPLKSTTLLAKTLGWFQLESVLTLPTGSID